MQDLAPTLAGQEIAEGFRLSPQQERLWLAQEATGHAPFRAQCILRVEGPLRADALEAALRSVVARHEILRTTFRHLPGMILPVQVISDDCRAEFVVRDFAALDADAQQAQLAALLDDAARAYDLTRTPLRRVTLARLAPQSHALLLSLPALYADRTGLENLAREIARAYDVTTRGAEVVDEPLQYADLAEWQNELLESAETEEGRGFWQRQELSAVGSLQLPSEQEGGAQSAPLVPRKLTARLDRETTARLREVATHAGTSEQTLLLACWQALLWRLTGQADVVTGVAYDCRAHEGVRAALGLFARLLPIDARLEHGLTLVELATRTAAAEGDAAKWQDYFAWPAPAPGETGTRAGGADFFNFCFEWWAGTSRLEADGVSLRPTSVEVCAERFKAKLLCHQIGGEVNSGEVSAGKLIEEGLSDDEACGGALVIELHYDAGCYEAAESERLLARYLHLLQSSLARPDVALDAHDIVVPAERRQVLHEFNDTSTELGHAATIHELVAAQAARTPAAIAVSSETEQLTYAELDARANSLAQHLLSFGVGPDVLVGVMLERSCELLIGLLAVLKAGGAYVPLDPAYPSERLAFMLADAGVPVLLTQPSLHDKVPSSTARVVYLDATDMTVPASGSDANPLSVATPDNLAYVIYTSGSTGRPKGVMVSHAAIRNRLLWMQREYPLTPADRVLQKTAFSFDASIWELFVPLLAGAQVVMARPGGQHDAAYLTEVIQMHEVTTLQLVPTMLAVVLEEPGWAGCRSLRRVWCGGEVVTPELVRRFFAACPNPDVELHNLYGPTETAIDASHWLCEREGVSARQSARGRVPIGRPLANLRVYVLDAELNPAPVGVAGELYVGGVQLARGYHRRPDLTAERFVPDPFSPQPGGRLYRTGDVGRWTTAGVLEYLGRADAQVKLRGYRIELGEVEALLDTHAEVRETVVLLREDRPKQQQLVAYVVPQPERAQVGPGAALDRLPNGLEVARAPQPRPPLAPETLRAFLAEKLPAYMVPTTFVMLDALPRLPNGKLDRNALPAPASLAAAESQDTYVAPRTAGEQTLANIWAQLLGVERVGIHDNFFSLGGDSILSIQIVARANRAGLRLSPALLFTHQTVAELAAVAGTVAAVASEQGPVTGELPLTPAQHSFFALAVPARHHWNQSVLLEARRPLDPALLGASVAHLFAHHDALRLRFVSEVSGWRQFNAGDEEAAPFTVVDLSSVPEPEQPEAISSAAARWQTSLDITEGPVARVVYFELGAGRPGRLLFIAHHLVVDGVSWRVLVEDLQAAYEQLSRGGPVALAPKSTSFRDWARRLDEFAQTEEARAELPYWLDESRRGVKSLPVDQEGAANTWETARTITVSLTAEETDALLHKVPQAYNTQIAEVLLAAVAQTFTRWTGEPALLVDVEGHGREEIIEGVDLARTVGWFTSLYPVLLESAAGARTGDLVMSIKEQLRAVPGRGIGYGLLRHLCRAEAGAARLRELPQSEVSFNYLGQFDQSLEEKGLFKLAPERSGATVRGDAARSHLLEITGRVSGGRLSVTWAYSERVHRRQTVETLSENFAAALRAIIAHCLTPAARSYTPSDFPLVRLDQAQLDRLTAGREIEDIYSLSPLQEGMLFHTVYSPQTGVYVEQVGCTVSGALDVAAFERAWQALLDRHAVLRAAFIWEGLDRPIQIIDRRVPVPFETQDWRAESAEERSERLDAFLKSDRRRGFEPGEPPLMRLTLLRVADDSYNCVWTFHHLLLDGWGVSFLLREVYAFVESFMRGEELRLEPSPPFRDYIAWLQKRSHEDAELYWRRALKGFRTPTPLGGDARGAEPAAPEAEHQKQQVRLSSEKMEALQAFARQHQLTMNTLVLAAWAFVLGRHAGVNDVVFGTVVSGRPAELPGVETIVGPFINTLPVRVRIEAEAGLLSWLKGLQAQQAEARAHEYSPLVQVRGWSEVPSALPLFESLLTFENRPSDLSPPRERRADQAAITIGDVFHFNRNNFPLTIVANPAGQLTLAASYDASRFDAPTIARLLGRMQRTLERMIAQPDARVGEIELLTEAEKEEQSAARQQQEASRFSRFKNVKPKAVDLSPASLVNTSYFTDGGTLPLVLRPAMADLDGLAWAANNRAFIDAELLKHGAILFRDFGLRTVEDFERFAESILPNLFSDYGDLPREEAGRKVYKSTPYPADKTILFHNESSHLRRWPLKQWFFCVTAAEQGGETPIVDCRRILRALPPALVERFAEKRLMYVRNFTDGLDVSWQEFFKTTDRDEVERLCRQAEIDFTWKPNGLSTRQICQAVATHPRTNEPVFFNQLQLHHISCIDSETRAAMSKLFAEEDYPRNVYYGDGTPIEDSVVEEICAIYWEHAVAFPWQAGDVLMVDNMLTAHGRNPFGGARKIVVAMGEMISAEELG